MRSYGKTSNHLVNRGFELDGYITCSWAQSLAAFSVLGVLWFDAIIPTNKMFSCRDIVLMRN